MSVEQQVDALATSVDELKGAVVTKKATLDASVVDAQSATAQAHDAKRNALSARDQAGAFKDAAYTAAQSAASAVAYQDLTALAVIKAVNAVDVFIYDTAKDSDGGAWRHRCAGTSWYREALNTATRGARRVFPAVAVIVAEAAKVTIYDGDDPSLPMWMVFDPQNDADILSANTSRSCASALNAVLSVGDNGSLSFGLAVISFVEDGAVRYRDSGSVSYSGNYLGNISERSAAKSWDGSNRLIVSDTINDVAMTVLPDAPVDPATGLPVPTIAVATAGGVSVIKDGGTVVDSAATATMTKVAFDPQGRLYYLQVGAGDRLRATSVYEADGFEEDVTYWANSLTSRKPDLLATTAVSKFMFEDANFGGVVFVEENLSDFNNYMHAYTTSTYLTGWQNGDIKGAFLSDTDDTDLVGSNLVQEDFSSYADTSALTAAGWVGSTSSNVVYQNATQDVLVERLSGEAYRLLFGKEVLLTEGQMYRVDAEADVVNSSSGVGIAAASAMENSPIALGHVIQTGAGLKSISLTFKAPANCNFIGFYGGGSAEFVVKNVTVDVAGADRSVNNKGLIVNGTITRSPVADGAELVAYSGFSAANYLEQPYNSALDFWTGDFCVMGWVKTTSTNSQQNIFFRGDESASGSYFALQTLSGYPRILTVVGNTRATGAIAAINNGNWYFVCGLRRSGTLEMFVNGSLSASLSEGSRDLTNASALARVGRTVSGSANQWGGSASEGSLALLRISATAPTAEQIAKIYNDEKFLFQDGAQATLFGASDTVTALAHDPVTDLLSVGTSAGRSDFQGLRRVAKTTVPVTKAIAAAGGMVVDV